MKKKLLSLLPAACLLAGLLSAYLTGNTRTTMVTSLYDLQQSIPAYCNIPAPNNDCRSVETGNIYPGYRSSLPQELENEQ